MRGRGDQPATQRLVVVLSERPSGDKSTYGISAATGMVQGDYGLLWNGNSGSPETPTAAVGLPSIQGQGKYWGNREVKKSRKKRSMVPSTLQIGSSFDVRYFVDGEL